MKLLINMIYGLRGSHMSSMNNGYSIHYFTSFFKNFIYPMSINKGRTTTTQGAHTNFMKNLSFLFFFSQ